jgi:diguanylate cyclase (GGDEF)-like protein
MSGRCGGAVEPGEFSGEATAVWFFRMVDRRRLATAVVLGLLWHALWALADIASVHPHASLWYPPAGLTFALTMVLKSREWPLPLAVVVVGTMLGRDVALLWNEPLVQLALVGAQALAHALPFVLAVLAQRGLTVDRSVTDATPALALLVVWPLAAAGSAGLGVGVLALFGEVPPHAAAALFVPWFTGDLVGVATTGGFFALVLAPALRRLLGPDAVVAPAVSIAAPLRPAVVGLALIAALGLVVLARAPALSDLAGGLAVAGYGPVLAMLLIARLAPPWQTHGALVVLTVVVMVTASMPDNTGHLDPQVVALALATAAQLGVSLRALADASERDPLTGVANRRAWLDGAQRRLLFRGSAAVILVDLDHFKAINDRFGHAAGDEVLRTAAAQLCHGAGEDAWCGRIGGEEFAALVPGDSREAERRVQAIRHALGAVPVARGTEGLVVRASYGVAPVASAADLAAALHAADAALYRAKAAGRDRLVHADDAVAACPLW